jgi:hypothetical protein
MWSWNPVSNQRGQSKGPNVPEEGGTKVKSKMKSHNQKKSYNLTI